MFNFWKCGQCTHCGMQVHFDFMYKNYADNYCIECAYEIIGEKLQENHIEVRNQVGLQLANIDSILETHNLNKA